VERSGIDPALIEDVYFGATNQAGEDNRNVARMAALLAGLPASVPGSTVNRLCASGLEAVNIAARMIEASHGDVFIAGGVESMSRAPYVLSKAETAFDRSQQIFDTSIGWRLVNPRLAALHHPFSMGETAENVARKHKISRADQDQFALQSQQRWSAAHQRGLFAQEIVPVEIPQRKGAPVRVERDEYPRAGTTVEKLAALKPAFQKDGTVTAGNASGINDGAAALVVTTDDWARERRKTPLGRVLAYATVGVEPRYMGMGPVPAVRRALERAGLRLDQIDLFELNEAFAVQSVAVVRELGIDPARVNIHGGAIALGHPIGASGARVLTTLLYALRHRQARYGVASLCIGGGMGVAMVVERG